MALAYHLAKLDRRLGSVDFIVALYYLTPTL